MDLFLQLLVNGLINGSHYALLGIGFGLIFSTTRLVHFAYGPIYAVAAFCAWYLIAIMKMPVLVGFAGAILAAVLLGLGCYIFVYRPLERNYAPPLVPLIASLGLYTVIENLIGIIFGTDPKAVSDLSYGVFLWGPVFFTTLQLVQILAFIVIGTALILFLKYTSYGKAILAMTDNAEMARIVGIDTIKLSLLVFIIGSAISAVPAALIMLKDSASTHMGFTAVFMGFVAVVVGGIGSLRGAAAGGMLLGLIESVGLWKIPTDWQSSIAFIILFLMIMLRPEGLFGVKR